MSIKAVIFDLDDTLYNFDTLHREAHEALRKASEELLGIPGDVFMKSFTDSYREVAAKLTETAGEEKGVVIGSSHSRTMRLQYTLEKLGLPLYPNVMKLYDVYWGYILDRSREYREPYIEEAMKEIRRRGMKIGVGTNMTIHIQYEKIERMGLGEYIDFMVTSDETIYDKPDPRFFREVVRKAGCLPEECVFVGDNKAFDYRGARDCGLHGIWYNAKNKPVSENDIVIMDHTELIPMIERLEKE